MPHSSCLISCTGSRSLNLYGCWPLSESMKPWIALILILTIFELNMRSLLEESNPHIYSILKRTCICTTEGRWRVLRKWVGEGAEEDFNRCSDFVEYELSAPSNSPLSSVPYPGSSALNVYTKY